MRNNRDDEFLCADIEGFAARRLSHSSAQQRGFDDTFQMR